MSAIYAKYLGLEARFLALQACNPDDCDQSENALADQLADMWYDLDESERSSLKQVHALRLALSSTMENGEEMPLRRDRECPEVGLIVCDVEPKRRFAGSVSISFRPLFSGHKMYSMLDSRLNDAHPARAA
jgi:hypothetical protein